MNYNSYIDPEFTKTIEDVTKQIISMKNSYIKTAEYLEQRKLYHLATKFRKKAEAIEWCLNNLTIPF